MNGFLLAENGRIEVSGSDVNLTCGLLADTIKQNGSNLYITGEGCATPVAKDGSYTTPEDTPVEIQLIAEDLDNDPLTFQIIDTPQHGVLTGEGSQQTYTPDPNFFGQDSLTFRVSDGVRESNIATVSITVTPVNDAPNITSDPVLSVTNCSAYQYRVVADDPDQDVLTYTIVTGPSGLIIDPVSGLLSWATPEAGLFSITVRVDDDHGGSDEQRYELFINGAPEITSVPIVEHQTGSTYLYQVVALDPENDTLVYEILEGPQGIVIDTAGGLISWPEPLAGEFSISIQVTDDHGCSDQQDFLLFVNGPPVITSTPITEHQAGIPYSYQVVAVDPNNDELNYSLLSGPNGLTIDAATGLISWASPLPGDHDISVHVSDGRGGSDEQAYSLKIHPPPTIEAVADPAQINKGDGSWLYWQTTNADSVVIDHGLGSVALHGCFGNENYYPDVTDCGEAAFVTPEATATYTLTADGPGGTASTTVTVAVNEIPPPTVEIFANPQAIVLGESSQLVWHSTNAETVTIDQGVGSVALTSDDEPGFGREIFPETTTTYTITATGVSGTATDSVTVTVTVEPPTVDITAIPESIALGEQSQLFWSSTNAHTVSIDQEIGTVALNSTESDQDIITYPQTTTTYTITATGPGGTATDSVTVNVAPLPPPTVEIIAVPETIELGDSSWLYWHSTNAGVVSISQGIGVIAANGCYGGDNEGFPLEGECSEGRLVSPQTTTTYTITAIGPGGIATDSVTVTVTVPPPTVDITANPDEIDPGDISWLKWYSTNAETVTIDQEIGVVAVNDCNDYGGEVPCEFEGLPVSPTSTTTYTITATGHGGTATDSVTVVVNSVPPPTVEIYADPNEIDSGDTSWLEWHSTNATNVVIDQDIGVVAWNSCLLGRFDSFLHNLGQFVVREAFAQEGDFEECGDRIPVSPTVTTTYTVTATGPGGTATDSITVVVDSVFPPSVNFSTESDIIDPGESTLLHWYSTNAETVTIDQGIGVVAVNDCNDYGGEVPCEFEGLSVSPTNTTTYTITATGPGGSTTESVTVTVEEHPLPLIDIFAKQIKINSGDSSSIKWHSKNADTVSVDPGVGDISLDNCSEFNGIEKCSGYITVTPTITTTYIFTATGPGGTSTDSITIYVDEEPHPSVQIYAEPEIIILGNSSWIEWYSINADTVSIDPWVGVITLDDCVEYNGIEECFGYITVTPTITTTYTITVTGAGLIATESVTVTVDGGGAPTAEFYAESTSLFRGDSTTLHWRTDSADTVYIDQGIGEVTLNSDEDGLVVSPDATTTYTLTATGPEGRGTISVTVIVLDPLPPIVDLIAWPDTVELGQDSTLAWSSSSADSVVIEASVSSDNNQLGEVALNSGINGIHVIPGTTTTYTITATGPGGIAVDSVTVNVLPQITITPCSQPLIAGDSCDVTIHTINGETVEVDQGIGPVEMTSVADYEHSGTVSVSPLEETIYTVTAAGNGGTSTATTTVHVSYQPPPTEFSASPQVLNKPGDTATLSWSTIAAHSCSVEPGIGSVPINGSIEVTPSETTVYTLTAIGLGGTTTKTVTVAYPAPVVALTVDPITIWNGNTTVLQWESSFAETRSIDNEIGLVQQNGSLMINPTETTTYTLTASNDDGTSTASVTVIVRQAETNLTVDQQSIETGQSATLHWTSNDTDTCSLQPGAGSVALGGSLSVSPTETTTYTLTCQGGPTSSSSSQTIYINNFNNPPVASITADSLTIQKGQSTVLSWDSINGTSFHLDNGIGNVAFLGSLEVAPMHTTTYTFTVVGPAGIAQSKITISVNGTPSLQPDGSFGKFYENLIPADATVLSYEARRFAIVKGSVQDIHGAPLAGVSITMLDHPQYGTAITNDQGEFALVVEGGTSMTVKYHGENLLPSQRLVYVPWNDIAQVKPVQMIIEDDQSTTIHFDGNPETVITHRASVVTDQFGSRSMTMVFQGDNQAFLVDENGEIVNEMTTIVTRATEYSTPQSMPAELPEISAYTYCAELTVDNAQRVRFAKPVITFIENFLGFDVGESVPLGYYDRDRGVWVAAPNGLVVRLLDTDNDGVVDALDGDNDGIADDLNNNGDVHDEVLGLNDPVAYPAGATFWRAGVTHFTPWDYNWCTWSALSDMNNTGDPEVDGQPCKDDKTCTGSSVSNETRIFREQINIPGTGFRLVYSSDRTEGYNTRITVPVSGPFVPSMLKRIDVEVEVAGRLLTTSLDSGINQIAEVIWDGLDFQGKKVNHKVTAHVKIGYVYDSVYLKSNFLKMSFAEFGTTTTEVPSRKEVVSWKQSDMIINIANKDYGLAQGWSISAHHKLTPTDPSTLHKGDGSVIGNSVPVITTIAGNGEEDWAWSGSQALETSISNPMSVVIDPHGNLYIANQVHSAILKLKRDNTIEVVAGGPVGPFSEEDNIPAGNAGLQMPSDLALDSMGNLYIADSGACKIRKIDTLGIITTVAGTGTCESSGDDGPALEAGIMPNSVAVDDFGNIYFIESSTCVGGEVDPVSGECIGGDTSEGSYRIRKVSSNGNIATVVGTGEKYDPAIHGDNGDGGHASNAVLHGPISLTIDPKGNIYFSDGARIRKVNTSGTITTVVGTGMLGYSGDDGLATEARIALASGIIFDRSGNFYFSQYFFNGDVVRKVSSNGYISTVAGEGVYGLSGDFGPATYAQLFQPRRIAIDPAGFLYIPDNGNHLIRKVSVGGYSEGEVTFAEANGLGHMISASGLHQTTFDLESGIPLLDFDYNDQDQLISITDQSGNVTSIERMGDGAASAFISADGLRTDLTIDGNKQLTRITYPDSNFYSFEYENNDGLLTAKTEPNGNRFEHFFDSDGRITETNNQEGGLWQFGRLESAEGITSSTISTPNTTMTINKLSRRNGTESKSLYLPSGEVITSFVASNGLETGQRSSCGPEIWTRYDIDRKYGYTYPQSITATSPAGLISQTSISKDYFDQDPDGLIEQVTETITTNNRSTTLVHDVSQAQITATSPEGRISHTIYDPNTLLPLSSHVHGLLDTEYSYYPDGRIQSISTGSRTTSYTYDGSGNLATATAPDGHITRFTDYDEVGRLLQVEQADGSIIGYDYDAKGNMTLLTTPTPADNAFSYNGFNKRSTFKTPLDSTTSYRYNEERRLTGVTLPSGREIDNTYEDGLLSQTTTPEWTNTYAYSCGGLLGSVTRGTQSIRYTYDGDLVTGISQNGTLSLNLGFTYNNDFNLSSFSYGGTTKSYTYDNDGLLTEAGDFSITRNSDNGLPETVSGYGLTLNRVFNGYGEVESLDVDLSGSEVFGYNLTRDDNGRITTKVETINGVSSSIVYTYDDLGRLLSVTGDSLLKEEYQYDANGNRTYELNIDLGIGGRNLTYSVEDHIITAGDITFEFDYDDNLAARVEGTETTEYQYSSTGELMSVSLPDGTSITYIHDPNGRRIAKLVDGVIVEKYLWSGLTTLLAVYDGSDTLVQRFEYADGRMPVAMSMDGSTYYPAYDQVGTLRLVADSAGNVVKQIDYDTFGNILSDSNPGFTVPFGFAGGLHDRDTGLVRFGYRDYMPEIGKWTAKDPILFAGGDSNLYGYVLNDPVNFVDPWGLWENPIEFWQDFGGGSKDFLDNYKDMRDANTIGSDKYFHCKANCEAAKRGLGGKTAAETISEGRELVDEYVKGDSKQQCNADRSANQQGRNYDPNKSCRDQCKSLRPQGLDSRY